MVCTILGTCIVAMGLTQMDISDRQPLQESLTYYEPFTQQYTTTFDVAPLFTPKNTPWSIAGTFIMDNAMKIDLGYSSKIDTDKLDVSPGLTLGITKSYDMDLDKKHGIIMGASTTFGGRTSHEPCVASYVVEEIKQSRHACVQGLPEWDTHKFQAHQQPVNLSLTYEYRF